MEVAIALNKNHNKKKQKFKIIIDFKNMTNYLNILFNLLGLKF